MNKIVTVCLLFALVLFSACSVPKTKTTNTEVSDNTEVKDLTTKLTPSVDDLNNDLSDIESLNEDLSIDELDSLDKELEELESLDIE